MSNPTFLVVFAIWSAVVSGQTADEAMRIIEKLSPGESVRVGALLLTLNQKQAGEPDEDGWYPASSVTGRFHVRMPVPFNDLTMVSNARDGTTVTSDTVGGRSGEGARFVANCIRRSDGKVTPDFAESITDSLAKQAPGAERRAVQKAGAAGIEIRILKKPQGLFLAQYLSGKDAMCQVLVEYSGAEMAAVESAARIFIDSFEMIAEPSK